MEKISLGEYDIFVGDIWKSLNGLLIEFNYSKIVVLIDENSRHHCLSTLLSNTDIENLKLIEIPSGEIHKSIDTCNFIWEQMINKQLDRNALVINLGGGVIGDMGGFCASTFKRGVDFIQIPTTLLSQVDSSIGGKLGIDFGDVKNSIGLFKNPKAVFIYPDFLKTLPIAEVRSGFAEMIKHGLIADREIWEELKTVEDFEKVNWTSLIVPSLKIKKQIVEADPFEKNVRKKLNFGHTIGHAIESLALKSEKPLLHGEAVAAGMICEAWLSVKKNNLPKTTLNKIAEFILKTYDKVSLKEATFSDLIDLMKNDKKNEGAAINFTLLSQPGEASINHTCDEEMIAESLKYYIHV